MNTAVNKLQKAVAEGEPSLTQLLRQTREIATRLNQQEALHWVDLELGGFAEGTEVPSYRKIFVQRLEVYNSHREIWQFAGDLNYGLNALQPIAEIEAFSRKESIAIPVAKNFPLKNEFGDSFGSDWPQQFVVSGAEYARIVEVVAARWTAELEKRGIGIIDLRKFAGFLSTL